MYAEGLQLSYGNSLLHMKILITGGAGFIGSNASFHFLNKGHKVTILDNFSRKGAKANVDWIRKSAPSSLVVIEDDIRKNSQRMQDAVRAADVILHLAGQVAVTTSVTNPREDFEINALGTFNLLEAARQSERNPIFLFSSTNKVYGGLEEISTVEKSTRYDFKNLSSGVSEDQNLDFHSPYGCSKGAADQYVRDYHRIYGLRSIVFRQSCIYGPRQFGIEDQGWVAWFIIAIMTGQKISIYGNGKQVRDLLYIEDLVRAFDLAIKKIDTTKGQIYNIGGGHENTISIWYEFRPILEKLFGKKIDAAFLEARPGDQPIFVSDISKAKKDMDWAPEVRVSEGVSRLYDWVHANKELFA